MGNVNDLMRELAARAILLDLIAWIGGALTLYYVVRAAVRDGIQASGVLEVQRRCAAAAPEVERSRRMPDMRAD